VPLVLGIETSCDETGIGIVRDGVLLADEVASSVEEHVRFGGVVPEVASRAHLEAMVPTVQRALATAGVSLQDLDAVAVTSGPGLAGALLVGVAAAKASAVSAPRQCLRSTSPAFSTASATGTPHSSSTRPSNTSLDGWSASRTSPSTKNSFRDIFRGRR